MRLSIIVVCLNAGKALTRTVKSILEQEYDNYEVIIKDGGSTDGSIETLPIDSKISVYSRSDKGIYDAMNQAVKYAAGEYYIFLNCGDTFYDKKCTLRIAEFIAKSVGEETIFYGDCYTVNRKSIVRYPDSFNDYLCFSKTLCHQATVFPAKIFHQRMYQTQYKICADYEFYVYAYRHGYKFAHIPFVIASYEGNGASETFENRREAFHERREILKQYFSVKEYRANWIKLQLHGKGLRQYLAKSRFLYGIYSWLAGFVYRWQERMK